MSIDEIITVLQNKVTVLQNAKNTAINNGEISAIAQIEVEIISTQASIDKIKTLS
jgi:hypothetical protein